MPQPTNSYRSAVSIPARQDTNSIPTQISEHFQQIAHEFQLQHERNTQFDHRISSLERTTNKIDQNVETIMSRLDTLVSNSVPGPSKQRKTSPNFTTTEMLIDEDHPPSLSQHQHNGAYTP